VLVILKYRDYRVYGKKPKGQFLAKALTEEWEIKGEGWVRKN
jgi:ParB family transcriptional regulator, chromosome partitioning protein